MGEKEQEVELIHQWSAPRSLSTSLMYSFAQRDDIEVLDEPLYAHFLRITGVERPYREELLSKMESDGNKVVKEIIFGPSAKKYRYCKHMAKHRLPGLTDELMRKGKHFILIRNPLQILPSFDKVVPSSFLELGSAELVSIYSELSQAGKPPPVIDAEDLQAAPENVLRGLCEDLGIPFQASMLEWEAGPKSVDGIWAPWWYGSVHKSKEFASPRKYPLQFPAYLYDLLEQSVPFYNMLRRHVKPISSLKSPLPHPTLPVPANEKLLTWVGNEILPRESAKVSVFDSVVQGGDAVWEGLRIYKGKIFKLEEHLDRLFDSAKALAFMNVPTREEVKEAIFKTLITNGMFDNAHIRLTLTRGKKEIVPFIVEGTQVVPFIELVEIAELDSPLKIRMISPSWIVCIGEGIVHWILPIFESSYNIHIFEGVRRREGIDTGILGMTIHSTLKALLFTLICFHELCNLF